jgi:hypothetical protein
LAARLQFDAKRELSTFHRVCPRAQRDDTELVFSTCKSYRLPFRSNVPSCFTVLWICLWLLVPPKRVIVIRKFEDDRVYVCCGSDLNELDFYIVFDGVILAIGRLVVSQNKHLVCYNELRACCAQCKSDSRNVTLIGIGTNVDLLQFHVGLENILIIQFFSV